MKPARIVLCSIMGLAGLMATAAEAQDKVIAPSPSTATSLDLYDQPGATQPVRRVGIGEAGLPLPIQSSKIGYHQVLIDGQAYWLRGLQVRISRDSAAGCGTAAHTSSGLTIATPGAGKNAC